MLFTILSTLVALEFFYIMYLETVATKSDATARVFNLSDEDRQNRALLVLFKNQGVYNGLLAVLILLSLFVLKTPQWTQIFHVYIILVAAYGAVTSDPKILFKQAGLSILALLVSFF